MVEERAPNGPTIKSCSGTTTSSNVSVNSPLELKSKLLSSVKISKSQLRKLRNFFNRVFFVLFARVVVVLQMKIYVYNFADLTLIDCLDTCNNPNGLCALNPDSSNNTPAVLALPHTEKGFVKVRSFNNDNKLEIIFACHQGSIAAMALNRTGDLLATASEKGTIVRLWRVNQEKPTSIGIYRRGADKAEISDI